MKLILAFFITAWIARYLGPDRYGYLVYAIAIAELIMLSWSQGLKEVVISQNKEVDLEVIDIPAASFQLLILGNTFLFGILSLTLYLLDIPHLIKLMAVFCGLGIWFRSFEAFELWFHSHLKVRLTIRVQIISQLIYLSANVVLIILNVDLIWFAVTYFLQLAIAGIGFLLLYLRYNSVNIYRNYVDIQLNILRLGVYMILAKLAYISSFIIDKFLIEYFLGIEEVGLYTVSMKMVTTWIFISSSISLSFIPILTSLKGNIKFDGNTEAMFGWSTTVAILLIILLFPLSKKLIDIFFGSQYSDSIYLFKILIFSLPFLFMTETSKAWLVVNGKTKYHVFSISIITLLSIVLNLYLIPIMGMAGAALAFILAWLIGGMLIYFLFKETRSLAINLCQSFYYPWILIKKINLIK